MSNPRSHFCCESSKLTVAISSHFTLKQNQGDVVMMCFLLNFLLKGNTEQPHTSCSKPQICMCFLCRCLQECRLFFSYTLDCLQARTPQYIQLCEENIYSHENNKYISCAFFKEVVQQCGNRSYVWHIWRAVTRCGRWFLINLLSNFSWKATQISV